MATLGAAPAPAAGPTSGMPPLGHSFSLITKVTRICNLRCHYCNEWEDTKTVMSFRTLATLTKRALEHPDARAVTFIWHGGEPLVRGREFYDKALYLQRRLRRPRQSVGNAIQTNGTLVDERWADYFREHSWDVGLSMDGPQELHDAQRPRSGGRGSYESAIRAMSLFQERGVRFGVLTVVTEETLALGADAMFDWLVGNGVDNFAFLRLRPPSFADETYDPERDYVAMQRFGEFQRRIFDRWYERDDPRLGIREFDAIVGALFGKRPTICTLAGECVARHLGVNVNGDIYHCDRYVTDNDYRLGNVHRKSFAEMFEGERVEVLRARNARRVEGYSDCPWLPICHGGCPHNAYIAERSVSGYDPTCCGEAALIEHIQRRVMDSLEGARSLH